MKYKNLMLIAAKSNMSVLLHGESGAGKEVAARYIHDNSHRKSGPFVALNCGAIARNLAESILEGARKGAFTGATDQQGVVRAAEGGTLFLDEIGEMPLDTQCKLLRVLQERSVLPLGQTQSIPVNFRLICATNRDLKTEVAAGRFREDLYFRLNVFPVKIPALRERDDIRELSQTLWADALKEIYPIENAYHTHNSNAEDELLCSLNEQELRIISQKRWPGNVRQLKNVLQRYALLKPHGITLYEIITDEYDNQGSLQDSGKSFTTPVPIASTRPYATAPNWGTIFTELQNTGWNKSVAAKNLGISRGCLAYQIKKNGGLEL